MSTNFDDLLEQAKMAEKSVMVCLRGDLQADHEAAERDLATAQKRTSDSLAGNGSAEIIARIEALEAEMKANSYEFRFRALPKPVFRGLISEFPPRRDEDGDVVPEDRFTMSNQDAMLPALIRKCLVDPELDDQAWEKLNAKITDRQFGDLADAAWFVNRGEVDIPFSRAASLAKRNSSGE